MNKSVIVSMPDGSVTVISPAPEMFDSSSRTRALVPELNNYSDEEILQWIIDKDIPKDALEYKVVDRSEIPTDRTFRGAWTYGKAEAHIDVDIEKAHEIKREEMRELRKPMLAMLDVMYMRADEAGDLASKTEIANTKQTLRDVTLVALPENITDLKEFIPDVLKSEPMQEEISVQVEDQQSPMS